MARFIGYPDRQVLGVFDSDAAADRAIEAIEAIGGFNGGLNGGATKPEHIQRSVPTTLSASMPPASATA